MIDHSHQDNTQVSDIFNLVPKTYRLGNLILSHGKEASIC